PHTRIRRLAHQRIFRPRNGTLRVQHKLLQAPTHQPQHCDCASPEPGPHPGISALTPQSRVPTLIRSGYVFPTMLTTKISPSPGQSWGRPPFSPAVRQA
ncbi:MAG TPA: hypothetical protein VN828_01410, partial [Acidobacteriaceae bacterium]|nr:hypothetical protein [Acidobacteriaceae bacterium]